MRQTKRPFQTILCVLFITSAISLLTTFYLTTRSFYLTTRYSNPANILVIDKAVTLQNSLNSHSFNFPANGDLRRNVSDITLESVHAYKVLQEFQGIQEVPLDELAKTKVPNTVYYVWCPNRTLEFGHFLGILSIWKVMRPDAIELYHQFPLKEDYYDKWTDELRKLIPGFVTKPFRNNYYIAGKDSECSFWMGLALVNDKGGIYVATDIIVTEEILKLYDKNFTVIYTKRDSGGNSEVAVIMGNSKDKKIEEFRKTYNIRKKSEKEVPVACSPIDSSLTFMKTGPCHVIETVFHPKDIWSLSSNFGDFARKLLYGSINLLKPRSFLPGNIPKTVHYVWFGSKEMDFSMYLSMLSTLFIANATMVFIHGDNGLYGNYFEKILQDQRLKIIKHQPPHYIYGNQIYHIQHRSDIIRADVLLKYGGIYVDWDVVWLQDPDDIIQQGYDAVANYDHMPQKGFPNTINLGVLMAKPRSTFVKRWQDALTDYKSHDFLYNAVLLPYKIYEKYPQYLYIEKRLQVMCNFLRCHPVFHPQYKLFLQDQPFDWQTDVYSIHFTYPNPPEWNSEKTCRNSTGRFAEIGKYVLQHENKLLQLL